jgi:hypothetical protein
MRNVALDRLLTLVGGDWGVLRAPRIDALRISVPTSGITKSAPREGQRRHD